MKRIKNKIIALLVLLSVVSFTPSCDILYVLLADTNTQQNTNNNTNDNKGKTDQNNQNNQNNNNSNNSNSKGKTQSP